MPKGKSKKAKSPESKQRKGASRKEGQKSPGKSLKKSPSGKKTVAKASGKKPAPRKKAGNAPSSARKTGKKGHTSTGASAKRKTGSKRQTSEKLTSEQSVKAESVFEEVVSQESAPALPDDTGSEAGNGPREVEFVTFELLGRQYAVRVVNVEEILRKQRVTHVPRTKDFVLGITTVRGRILPVIDLAGLIEPGSISEYPEKGKVLVIRGSEGSVGVMLGRTMNIVVLTEEDIKPHPAHIHDDDKKLAEGVIKVGRGFVSVLDTEKVLSVPAALEGHEKQA